MRLVLVGSGKMDPESTRCVEEPCYDSATHMTNLGSSFGQSSIVTILVGQDKSKFSVHKDILVKACPFFAKCLASNMREATTGVIELPEDDSATFAAFVNYIYKVEILTCRSGYDAVSLAIKSWVLAEKFFMPRWQNRLIDGMARYWRKRMIHHEHLLLTTEITSDDHKLRHMVYAQFTWDVVNSEHSLDDQTLEDLSADSEVSKWLLRAMSSHAQGHSIERQPATTPEKYYESEPAPLVIVLE